MGRKKSFTNRKKNNKRKYEKQSPLPSKATCCTLQQTSTTPVFPPNISHNQQILRRLTILPLGWTIVSTGTSSDDKQNMTGEQMVPIFYEAMMRVERCGFKVTFITLDGNSVNRKYIDIVGSNTTLVKHKFNNPLSFDKREIYLFSDPPHLLKTARNCLSNPKRNMKVIIINFNYYHKHSQIISPAVQREIH